MGLVKIKIAIVRGVCMINVEDIINKIKLSKQSQVSLLVACFIVIGIAQSKYLIDLFQIADLLKIYLPYISILTIILISFILGTPVYDISKNYYIGYCNKKNIESYLKQLTEDEKNILRVYINETKRSHPFHISDGIVAGLINKNILYRATFTGIPGSHNFPYNIQDIAYNILRSHPEYVANE